MEYRFEPTEESVSNMGRFRPCFGYYRSKTLGRPVVEVSLQHTRAADQVRMSRREHHSAYLTYSRNNYFPKQVFHNQS